MSRTDSIEAVRQKHEDALMRLPNVNGVALGKKGGKDVIRVLVTHKVPQSQLDRQAVIPKTLDGYETDVEETGGDVNAQSISRRGTTDAQ